MPTTLEEALQIATTVGQAESQERTGSAFFLEAPPCHESHVSRSNESPRVGKNSYKLRTRPTNPLRSHAVSNAVDWDTTLGNAPRADVG
jgi:hypothetical protein